MSSSFVSCNRFIELNGLSLRTTLRHDPGANQGVRAGDWTVVLEGQAAHKLPARAAQIIERSWQLGYLPAVT
jgi:hypothetical protein